MSKQDINDLARIFMFEFKEDEKEIAQEVFDEYLELIKRMDDIDTSDVEMMVHPFISQDASLREDESFGTLSLKEVLDNAPEVIDEQIAVPKVVK